MKNSNFVETLQDTNGEFIKIAQKQGGWEGEF